MTDQFPPPPQPMWGPPVGNYQAEPAPVAAADDGTIADLRVATVVIIGLAALGALLGLLWSVWSGPQQRAYILGPGKLYPFDEVETMAGADGRYLFIVALVGLIAGVAAWVLRPANRGPLVLFALGFGGLAGAALTAWVGHLSGGGTFDGKTNTFIAHLPLSLHLHGLLFAEPAIAVLVYGLIVAFAARDDLGRPDAIRDRVSVGAGDHSQDGGGYRDAPGRLQERDLPPQ